MTAMEQKSDAASHSLKVLQNALSDLDRKEVEAQNRQLHPIKHGIGGETVSLVSISLWHGSTDKLLKSIDQRRQKIVSEMIEARDTATKCRMQLEAFKAILSNELKKEALKQRRAEQNQLPTPLRRLN